MHHFNIPNHRMHILVTDEDQLTKLIQTLGNKDLYPGEIRLSFVYFGDTKNIQVIHARIIAK